MAVATKLVKPKWITIPPSKAPHQSLTNRAKIDWLHHRQLEEDRPARSLWQGFYFCCTAQWIFYLLSPRKTGLITK
jgi:hypothetical protein